GVPMAPKPKTQTRVTKKPKSAKTVGSGKRPTNAKAAPAPRRPRVKRLAILTGGGDCPGLNAVVRAVVKTAMGKYGVDCYGIEDGYRGLIYRRSHLITNADVSGILHQGGTILGSSNKDNPFAHRMIINGAEQTV